MPSSIATNPQTQTTLDQEFFEGYWDGHMSDNPTPGQNRSNAYKHSFEIARREANNEPPIAAHISRQKAAEIEASWIPHPITT